MAQPVYNFLGYSLVESKYINKKKDNTYIGIGIPKDFYDENNKIYYLYARVSTDFSEEESYFIFQGIYKINDINWFNELADNFRKTIFFSVLFPFVREKIFSITSDSNVGLFIPTINIQDFNFEKELRLVKAQQITK